MSHGEALGTLNATCFDRVKHIRDIYRQAPKDVKNVALIVVVIAKNEGKPDKQTELMFLPLTFFSYENEDDKLQKYNAYVDEFNVDTIEGGMVRFQVMDFLKVYPLEDSLKIRDADHIVSLVKGDPLVEEKRIDQARLTQHIAQQRRQNGTVDPETLPVDTGNGELDPATVLELRSSMARRLVEHRLAAASDYWQPSSTCERARFLARRREGLGMDPVLREENEVPIGDSEMLPERSRVTRQDSGGK